MGECAHAGRRWHIECPPDECLQGWRGWLGWGWSRTSPPPSRGRGLERAGWGGEVGRREGEGRGGEEGKGREGRGELMHRLTIPAVRVCALRDDGSKARQAKFNRVGD